MLQAAEETRGEVMTESRTIVSIKGLTREQALCALFNAARTQGMGKVEYNPLHHLNEVHAGLILCASSYIDYLEGRVIKTEFPVKAETLDVTLYDRDNGEGAAGQAIDQYRRRVNGESSGFYVPLKFMGVEREKRKDGFSFDILGGRLLLIERRAWGFPMMEMMFGMPIPGTGRYLENRIERNLENGRIDGKDRFRYDAMHLIRSVLEKLSEV